MSVIDYLRTLGRKPEASAAPDPRFLALTEANAALVFIVEGDVIRYANRAARGGTRREDLVGERFSELAHVESRATLSQRMTGHTPASVLVPHRFELKLDGPRGLEPWIDLTLTPIEHEGRPAILAMGFDITDRKLAEGAMRESERRLRDLIENVQLVSVLLDARGDITFVNEYALELLGHHEEDVAGRNWFDLVVPLDRRGPMQETFAGRIATGTTGGLLNALAGEIGGAKRRTQWVRRFRSGPLGGDAEIALEMLDNRCQRIVFFEDPHVARQHEADIQLLERSARIATERAMCVSDRASAQAWVRGCELRIPPVRRANP
ncbi:MAG: PAS domain S-box protein [Casimicrobiaceae bacterium]